MHAAVFPSLLSDHPHARRLRSVGAEQSGVAVNTSGRGNVRYGPTTEARVITTLAKDTEVIVYEAVEGRAGWYAVAFPRQGHAWAHEKVLEATDDPNWFIVKRDGANVRSDSRISAELVTQLALGELVEFKGRKVGSWLAIHPRGAKAYMYKSVLRLTPDVERAIDERALRDDETEKRWQISKLRYEHYRGIFAQDSKKSLSLDWVGLDEELSYIVAQHPTIRTQLLAKRLQDNIGKVVRAAASYQQSHSIRPLADPEFKLPETTGVVRIAAPPVVKPTPKPETKPETKSEPQQTTPVTTTQQQCQRPRAKPSTQPGNRLRHRRDRSQRTRTTHGG